MSVVAVRKYEDKIVLAADLQTSWGDAKLVDAKNQMYLEPSKIWEQNGMVIGSAGYVSTATLLRVFSKTHKPSTPNVEGIIDFLVEFTDWAKKKDGNFKFENQLLVVYEGKMFQCNSYEVQEIKEYNAIGSGMFLALGAMYKGSDPEEAVEVAKQFDLFCSGKTDKIEILL